MNAKYWSENIKTLSPYVPGEQIKGRKTIRLNTNENPFPPSPKVKEAIVNALGEDAAALRLYPSFDMTELKEVLAKYHQVKPEQVFVGNSSDEVLAHVFNGFFRQKAPILAPDISYSFYPVYCSIYNIESKKIPLTEEFEIQVDDYLKAEHQANGGIVLANPNAPTGIGLKKDEIERLVAENQQSAVVIDEAYVDYGGESAIDLIHKYKNLLVVRTFSKSRSLAGLRVGYAIGDASLIEGLNRVKDSFNSFPVDTLAQVAAIASVTDEAYFQKQRSRVIENRMYLNQGLLALGFQILPSATNFLFATHSKMEAAEIQDKLKEQDILVRYFKQPRINNYLRITVGTKEECDALLKALKSILK